MIIIHFIDKFQGWVSLCELLQIRRKDNFGCNFRVIYLQTNMNISKFIQCDAGYGYGIKKFFKPTEPSHFSLDL